VTRAALALLFSLFVSSALAQNVTVIGPITPGDCPQFSSTTVIKDSGFSCNGGGVAGVTSLNGQTGALTNYYPAQGRLTLASLTPVMGPTSCASAPCTNKTTIYYDCYVGCGVPIYNGSAVVPQQIPGEVSDALPNSGTGVVNANDVFDEWWTVTGAICHVTNGSGGGWSADTGGSITARGTGYTQLSRPSGIGFPVNANSLTHCYHGSTDLGPVSTLQATYLGTFGTTASAGTVSYTFGSAASGGGAAFFGLWNYYNRINTTTSVTDTSAPYSTYTTHAYRQANGSSGNQITFVTGVAEDTVYATYNTGSFTVSVANAFVATSIGFDSPTVSSCNPGTTYAGSAAISSQTPATTCTWVPGVGRHVVYATEEGDGSNANTMNDNSLNSLSVLIRN
jgi:hypothetical protein